MVNVAIIGAGPYGLSIAAHLRAAGVSFRIFGRPMESWRAHMPKGMLLKSEGCASNLYAAGGSFTLKEFCSERGVPYADRGVPIPLSAFTEYGLLFQQQMVPELEERLVVDVERQAGGFALRLDSGELVA